LYLYWIKNRPGNINFLAVLITLLLPLSAYGTAFYSYKFYGTWFSVGPYSSSAFHFKLINVLGMFIDADFGIINLSPVIIAAIIGIPFMLIRKKGSAIVMLIYVFTIIVPNAAFSHWWLGFSPAGRFFLIVIPVLAVFFSYYLKYVLKGGFGYLFFLMPVFFLTFINSYLFIKKPELYYHADGNPFEKATGAYIKEITGVDLLSCMPSFPFNDISIIYLLILLSIIMTILFPLVFPLLSGLSGRSIHERKNS